MIGISLTTKFINIMGRREKITHTFLGKLKNPDVSVKTELGVRGKLILETRRGG